MQISQEEYVTELSMRALCTEVKQVPTLTQSRPCSLSFHVAPAAHTRSKERPLSTTYISDTPSLTTHPPRLRETDWAWASTCGRRPTRAREPRAKRDGHCPCQLCMGRSRESSCTLLFRRMKDSTRKKRRNSMRDCHSNNFLYLHSLLFRSNPDTPPTVCSIK